jgi:hypothetical protein
MAEEPWQARGTSRPVTFLSSPGVLALVWLLQRRHTWRSPASHNKCVGQRRHAGRWYHNNNPLTHRAITTVDASVDKNETVSLPIGTGTFDNNFRPLILQDGMYFFATIAGPLLPAAPPATTPFRRTVLALTTL